MLNQSTPATNDALEARVPGRAEDGLLAAYRIIAFLAVVFIVVPFLNPARVSALVSSTQSMLTSGTSFSALTSEFIRPVSRGWVSVGSLQLIFYASLGGWLGIAAVGTGVCMSLGEIRLKRLGLIFSAVGSVVSAGSASLVLIAYKAFVNSPYADRIQPQFPQGLIVLLIVNGAVALLSVLLLSILPRAAADAPYEMKPKYRLFLLLLPILVLTFVFAYLPLWGWAVSFFDYRAGFALTADRFVGFKWFSYLFQNPATRADILRVMRNTLAMSGLGLATSWVAMAFAIMLSEVRAMGYRRLVQTLTTIPNFISWVLIYTFALAMFSTEGFVNSLSIDLGWIDAPIQFLQNSRHVWLRMLGWAMWKGLGWSAIIYIAAITGIDPQLYEAATVDGAGRFRKMWHVTVPSLLPTYFVLLLLAIANILTNGMEQYYVFKNAMNKSTIEVLDLYVYVLGLGSGGASNVALATVVGFMKSIVSIVLLFVTNRASKLIRGESIV
ncbi:MAG: ABC transporter permease subunit [Spirochaetota bacterium]